MRLLCLWNSPGKNTGEGGHSLLQGNFLTQGLNLHLLHCRQILYCLSHRGLPRWIPWRRKWQHTSVLLPEEFHGQRSPVDLQSMGLQSQTCLSTCARAHTHTHTHTVRLWPLSWKNCSSLPVHCLYLELEKVVFNLPLNSTMLQDTVIFEYLKTFYLNYNLTFIVIICSQISFYFLEKYTIHNF